MSTPIRQQSVKEIIVSEYQMGLQSCLWRKPVRRAHGPEVLEGSITHASCNYEPATNMWATVDPDPKKTRQAETAKTIHNYHPLSMI